MSLNVRGQYMLVSILAALVIGLIFGWVLAQALPKDAQAVAASWLKAFGDIFVRLIRVIIPLLIFFTISAATCSIADARKLGRILAWMLFIYIITSVLAAAWGVIGGLVFKPGVGLTLEVTGTPPTPPQGPDILLSFFQTDFSALLTVGGAMTMIILAMIIGISATLLGERGRKVAEFLKLGSDLMVNTVRIIMYYAPVAVFSYAGWLMLKYGVEILGRYASFLAVQYGFSLFHFIVIYSILSSLGGVSPLTYFKNQLTPFFIAFTTRSSAATLPANLEAARKDGVPDEVFNITLPIGATVNMDGTALYQALAAVFIAQLFGIALTPYHISLIIFAALIGSIATAAIPGGGTIMLAYVLSVVGLPLEGVAIMLAIDPLTDAIRTALNVSGDVASTIFISRILGYIKPKK